MSFHVMSFVAFPTSGILECGGKSRLILIDLGSCVEEHSKNMVQLSFSELSSVMLALLRGGKQVPNRHVSRFVFSIPGPIVCVGVCGVCVHKMRS